MFWSLENATSDHKVVKYITHNFSTLLYFNDKHKAHNKTSKCRRHTIEIYASATKVPLVSLLPWPLTSDLENPLRNTHSSDKYLCYYQTHTRKHNDSHKDVQIKYRTTEITREVRDRIRPPTKMLSGSVDLDYLLLSCNVEECFKNSWIRIWMISKI